MFKFLSNTIIKPKIAQWNIKRAISSLNYQSKYNEKESEDILAVVNSKTDDELSRFQLTKTRARKIEMWKGKHGQFTSIAQILELDGFGIKVLENFCNSILKGVSVEEDETDTKESEGPIANVNHLLKKVSTMTIPTLPEFVRARAKTCVSVYIGISRISWSSFKITDDREIVLSHLNYHELEDKKYHVSDLMNLLLTISDSIPVADVYVIENPQTPQTSSVPGSVLQMNVNLQKSQLVAMLSLNLAARTNVQTSTPRTNTQTGAANPVAKQTSVYFLKKFLASRLFNLFVGNENVSTEGVVHELLGLSQPSISVGGNLIVSQQITETYGASCNVEKEVLGQALLLGVAFMKLCLLRDPESVSRVLERNRL